MTRHLTMMASAALVTMMMFAPSAAAHNEYRIIGTVHKLTATTIDVRQAKDGKLFSMKMDAESVVTRDKQKVPRSEIKVGGRVVVDACGDSVKNLLVMEVRLLPPPRTGF
jgi:hypothetical protein